MHHFPVPYPDELIYSLVARAGIRSAITSPKQLLEQVFGDRKVIATLDLPSHLSAISSLLVNTGKFDVQRLIYEHTMFPIYAPFVDESTRIRALKGMGSRSKSSVHLMLGAVASIVKTSGNFRSCFLCVAEQQQKYGESYWSRLWHLPSLPHCPIHGLLNQSSTSYHDNRHTYHLYDQIRCNIPRNNDNNDKELLHYLAKKAQEVLLLPCQKSPTKHQWSKFYNHLAHDFSCGKGTKQVSHEMIAERVIKKVAIPELAVDFNMDTNWLRTIFRHHRKAFSYLQHLTVWSAFIPDMTVSEIIKEVKKKGKANVVVTKILKPESERIEEKHIKWRNLISTTSIKKARSLSGGGALYAWLYRNDKEWLLAFNRQNYSQSAPRKKKVNWDARDRVLTKQLLRIIDQLDTVITGPRRSKNYLLKQLKHSSTLSKKLPLMPKLTSTLNRYQESTFEFQARRLTMTVMTRTQAALGMSRWQLMRSASLSEERIQPIVEKLLDWIVMESNIN
ncbi:hypothetical protein NBRC116592_09290 [Colwellia sp. KU-HH00111]|uniref:TnsD family Tn7-like transposition protein n=1 Tax=Colwellia sp. KU-HH00111 TaxID=3127652 RepID=UPI00310506C9